MPKREDIKSVLIIGSGPIIIGQACEFDYSGTQAIKALREEGVRVILVNSNPATIMTDPAFADATYIEPITAEFVERVIEKERPDAVLPTMGGQTALNVALELNERGVFERYKTRLIGASVDAIITAEDRDAFKQAMSEIGIESARSGIARSVTDAENIAKELGFPLILRPSRTLGGTGGGIAKNLAELKRMTGVALSLSPNHEVLIEESLLGWKEIELEVMRDRKDNVVIICGIENIDPMGVHTGDSITVAPIQTLTDKEYQYLRDATVRVIRRIGVETGGSNVQFAVNPENGRVVIVEMNPRVSRSSALASKATGFPIAKIAAKLALGYTLDEIPNDITQETPSCFEPSIDYVVVKIPRFNFEKFSSADPSLGTQMKSVGEAMAMGRTFEEAFQKAMLSLEAGATGLGASRKLRALGREELIQLSGKPRSERMFCVLEAFRQGASVTDIANVSRIDRWFLRRLHALIQTEEELRKRGNSMLRDAVTLETLKRLGFSDARLAELCALSEQDVRKIRNESGVIADYSFVDTCAGEFEANTPYLYSSYSVSQKKKKDEASNSTDHFNNSVLILGSGPNRIGQGIEFDYCCVHAVFALQAEGVKAVMVNCNPETVSTDYDVSDALYFEPLTIEHVLAIAEREKPKGIIVQFGGQTPLKLARALHDAGVPLLGTPVSAIEACEDRELFADLVQRLGLKQPVFATARSFSEAREKAKQLDFPLMIRPSFVLGGRAMRVVFSDDELESYIAEGVDVSEDRPVLLDRFLQDAIEVDVDAVCDCEGNVVIAGIMEHIERAGVHSGDSSCCLPPESLSPSICTALTEQATLLARETGTVGVINIQFAVQAGEIYVLEVNPRASRTIPFVSKATNIPWAGIATKVMLGKTLLDLGVTTSPKLNHVFVKACVFPFDRFTGVDTLLGPEMKSTGEVMGIGEDFAEAFYKSQVSARNFLPTSGSVFLSVRDEDKDDAVRIGSLLAKCGLQLIATEGTAKKLKSAGLSVELINKVRSGSPHIVDALGAGKVQLVVNTPEGSGPHLDSTSIRLVANELRVPTYTTTAAAYAAAVAIKRLCEQKPFMVKSLQEIAQEKSVAHSEYVAQDLVSSL